ncbi:uncharacterized protein LOC112188473 isoform X3 [Rosa chinensis]|uniref:uncharacterized protein LOC112188473 isoform X3 n=1 Tax=Rosa chinensis TaxID=74649 RepID=UPI000D086F1B|nr:uncharacterized protein LOC112188473 isoform X3 [Rosa chinensis]
MPIRNLRCIGLGAGSLVPFGSSLEPNWVFSETSNRDGTQIVARPQEIQSSWKKPRRSFRTFNKPILGMGDFLNEMAVMMSQTKPNENGGESFEQLQELFEEMFQGDIESFSSCSQPPASCSTSSSSYVSYCESSTPNNKRNSSEMNYGNATLDSSGFDTHFHSFCVGAESQQGIGKGMSGREGIPGGVTSRRREGRKQKVTSGHDVSSNDHSGISAR